MEKKIKEVLEQKVNPVLAEHYGGATLVSYEDKIVWVKLTGACGSCPSAQMTIEGVIKKVILEECPEVEDVRLDNTVSEDILDMARKILNKEV